VVAAFNRYEHCYAEPDLVLINQRHPAQNDVVRFEPLDPLPAGC
jgi:hypothetical protein